VRAGGTNISGLFLTRDWERFDPRAYLNEYYADLGAENCALLRFLVEAYRDIAPNSRLLDFGGGPTIYPLIAAVSKVKEIHFCDYLESNLREVQNWLCGDASAFDWRAFIGMTLELERARLCSAAEIAQREGEIRTRVTRIVRCDVRRVPPITGWQQKYDVVVSNFCAESVTDDWWQWRMFMRNITSLLKPGGKLVLAALKEATCYSVGSKIFPAVKIVESDLTSVLIDSHFEPESIVISSNPADRPTRNYQGLMFAVAVKSQ
jgi:nicotinamide N-methyltransferase